MSLIPTTLAGITALPNIAAGTAEDALGNVIPQPFPSPIGIEKSPVGFPDLSNPGAYDIPNDEDPLTEKEEALLKQDPTDAASSQVAQVQEALANPIKSGVSDDVAAAMAKNPTEAALATAQTDPSALGKDKVPPSSDSAKSNPAAGSGTTATAAKSGEIPKFTPSPNPLLDAVVGPGFPSYTYSLSLHSLTVAEYDSMMAAPQSYKPKSVLIASAGRFGENFKRNEHFKEDFYFEKLDFETVIGMNNQTRGANSLDMHITLIEPYGTTLIERIVKLGKDLGSENYMMLPYLVEIEFYGHTDAGVPTKITELTKYLPVKIVTVNMKITHKGAEYEITTVPFSHQAFQETISSAPIDIGVEAASLEEFFEPDSEEALVKEELRKKEIREEDAYRNPRDVRARGTTTDKLRAVGSKAKNPKSFRGAMNRINEEKVKDGHYEVADEIAFVFHPEILKKSKFVHRDVLDLANRKMDKPKDKQNLTFTRMADSGHPKAEITVSAGASIIDVITLAVKNSQYIYDQILDVIGKDNVSKEKVDEWLQKPFKWFKIIPRVHLKEYDKSRNIYASKTIFYVVPFIVYNFNSNEFPMGEPDGYVKEYEYIFTGKNKDILNLDLVFNVLYYTAQNAKKANQAQGTGAANQPAENPNVTKENKTITKEELTKILNERMSGVAALKPTKVKTSGHTGSAANKDPKAEAGKEVEKSQLSDSAGDMIQVKMKIVGDPDFIKQDDYFYKPTGDISRTKDQGGSIVTDMSEIFVKIHFDGPNDYDDNGIAIPDRGTNDKTGIFTGKYKVITVKNSFSNGKFEQELDLIRQQIQKTETVPQTTPTSTELRPVAAVPQGTGTRPTTDASSPAPSTTITAPTEKTLKDDMSAALPNIPALPELPGLPIDVDAAGALGEKINNVEEFLDELPFGDLDDGEISIEDSLSDGEEIIQAYIDP